MADGLLPPLGHPETSVLASMLYPLRGAETLAMVTVMGATFWGFTILVPEYCLGVWADASAMGTPSMGMLVILISALPALLLLPLIVIYMMQYLGRVLVSSAMGDTVPPRTPDRNFDGLFSGLSPWLTWLVFGGLLGLSPLVLFAYFEGRPIDEESLADHRLCIVGIPYALTSLMLSFLHDAPGRPPLPASSAPCCATVSPSSPSSFKSRPWWAWEAWPSSSRRCCEPAISGLYLATALGCWGLAIWIALVTMRVLGLHYHRNRDRLKWQHADPRWGVSWRL